MSPEERQQQEEEDELLVDVSLSPLDRLLKFSTSKMVLQRYEADTLIYLRK